MYSIGEIISTYRKKKGLLQQDLADELAKEGIKISYKAISNWERNLAEPSVTIFYKVCRILGITNMYEAYFGVNPADPFSSLTDEGREKAMDYINLLHASGMYEKQTAKIIPFRSIDIFENAVSAGTGNFLVDGPKETVRIDESILPEDTTFGVRISGDSMEPEFHDGQIAWVLQQESVANGEIGIFALNGEAYIKKLKDDKECINMLKEMKPDFIVVVAFGQLLTKEVLDIPKYGCINLHGSILPMYRGAAPIQWAVINGEKESGNTTMLMNEGLDTGDILLQDKVKITEKMTAGEL